MPSKNRIIRSINYHEKDKEMVEKLVKWYGISLSKMVMILLRGLEDGIIDIEGERVVNPITDPYYETYKKMVGIMEDRGMEVGECLEGMIQRLQER